MAIVLLSSNGKSSEAIAFSVSIKGNLAGTWSLPDVHTSVIDNDAFPLVSFDGKVLHFSVVRSNNNGEEVLSTLTYSK